MFASDVYGVVLGYYDNDYSAIKTVGGPLKPFELAYAGSDFDGASDGLYNGNIKNATVSLRRKIYYGDTDISMSPIGYAYTYDQLNRYVKMRAYNNYDTATNEWQSGGAALQDYAETVSYDGNGNILNYIRHGNPTIGTPTGLTAMDSMTYSYNAHNNQLNSVTDGVPKSNYTTDIDNEVANNYLYDKNGEMTYDSSQHLKITWNVRNKVATVMNDSTHLLITFGYDAMGNRVMKKDSNLSSGKCYALWYIRDAQGNVLSMYKERHDSMWWQEADIYGSSRVGVYYADSLIYPKATQVNVNDTFTMELWEGKRQYGLVNHLGNVLTTISDKKIMLASNATPNSGSRNAYGNIIDYQPEVVSINDYYPGGMPEPGRNFSLPDDTSYHFGFNGMMKDDDIEGKGDLYTADFWEYDSRLVRRWNVDPIVKDWESSYAAFDNNPIVFSDPNGADATDGPACDDNSNCGGQPIASTGDGGQGNSIQLNGQGGGSDWTKEGHSGTQGTGGTSPSTPSTANSKTGQEWASKPGAEVHQEANSIAMENLHPHKFLGILYYKTSLEQIEVDEMNKGTEYADESQFQTGAMSYRHAMRDADNGQTVEEAMEQSDFFVRTTFATAKQLLKAGDIKDAYFIFGIGLHVLQDATSPAHGGFQPWGSNEGLGQEIMHVTQEYTYPGVNSNLQNVTTRWLEWFQSDNDVLPAENLFLNIHTDPSERP